MNATLKSICALLRQGDQELKKAAIQVLGAIHARDPGVHKALGELLIVEDDPAVFVALLETIEQNPHEQALRFLLKVIERNTDYQERILNAVSRIGGKAVVELKRHYERVPSPTKCEIVKVLPKIRTSPAHAFLVDSFFEQDHEIVRSGVHALREEISGYDIKERTDLYNRLIVALKDRRLVKNDAALSAVIIALGILADIRCKSKLLPLAVEEHSPQIRRHALMSLARMEFVGDKHGDVFDALLPLLNNDDYEGFVRHVVQVLFKIKPRRSDNGKIQDLLTNRHSGVQVYAIQALSQLNSITNAEKVLSFLGHPDPRLREAAGTALRGMSSAVEIVLRHLETEENRARAFEMVKILESHGNKIKPDRARIMVKKMLSLYEKNDERYQLYRTALRHLRGEVMQAELLKLAEKAGKQKEWVKVRDYLKLLDHTELLSADIRLELTIAKLKTSKKDRSRTFRQSDYCLEHIAFLLREDPKGFRKKFLAEKVLDAEDYLYVGFHFAERLNEERRFGADILRHVKKKWPRAKAAGIAAQKLKLEGH